MMNQSCFEVQTRIGEKWEPFRRFYHERSAKWTVTNLTKKGHQARYVEVKQ